MSAARVLTTRNIFFRSSLRCAVIQLTSEKPTLLQYRLVSGKTRFIGDDDERIPPLLNIGFTKDEAASYIRARTESYPILTVDRLHKRISYFKANEYKDVQIKEIMKRKMILRIGFDRLTTNERVFTKELGFDADEAREMVVAYPNILLVDNMLQHFKVLSKMRGESEDVFRNDVKTKPYQLLPDPLTVQELREFETEYDIPEEVSSRWLKVYTPKQPFRADQGRRCVQLLRDYGFEEEEVKCVLQNITFIHALKEKTLKSKLKFLQADVGLSIVDVKLLLMTVKGLSEHNLDNLTLKVDYLIKVVGLSTEEFVRSRRLLIYSLNRVKARHEFTCACELTSKVSLISQVASSLDKFLSRCGKTEAEYYNFCMNLE